MYVHRYCNSYLIIELAWSLPYSSLFWMNNIKLMKNFFFFFFCLFRATPRHMEVPKLGVELELQPPAYTTATATPDPSYICDLHHSSQQHEILNPLSKARDWTSNLSVPSWICFRCTMTGTPIWQYLTNWKLDTFCKAAIPLTAVCPRERFTHMCVQTQTPALSYSHSVVYDSWKTGDKLKVYQKKNVWIHCGLFITMQ